MSIGSLASARNGSSQVTTNAVTRTQMTIPTGSAMRSMRTRRLCRAAVRNTCTPSLRPLAIGGRLRRSSLDDTSLVETKVKQLIPRLHLQGNRPVPR
jgi:hypothetical protein